MRTTTTNRWVWVFAGALPAVALGAGCGDDSAVTGATSGGGGFGGFGGGDATQASSSAAGTPTSSSSGGTPTSSSSSGTPSSSSSASTGGEGGTGGDPGEGGGGADAGGGGEGGAPPGGCDSNDDCDDLDDACRDVSCDLARNTCTDIENLNEGGLVDGDEDDDCVDLRCVAGVATEVADDTETPPQDADVCTVEACEGGDVVSDPGNDGDACGNDGGECLDGECVECVDVSDCPAATDCQTWACEANECVATNEPEGTVVDAGEPNDCLSIQCDGDGGESEEPDDGEEPSPAEDANQCTDTGICLDGAPFYPNEPDGTPCTDGGVECTVGVCGARVLFRQDFDALPTAGTPTLTDFVNALNQGWVLTNTNGAARVGPGSSNAGAIYNFGADGDTERALGGVASGGTLTNAWGVCFTNAGAAASVVNVAYDGEQWREGGNMNALAQSLAFSVSTFVTPGTLAANIGTPSTGDRTTGWQDIAALNFTSPLFMSTSGVAVDGNTAGRVAISGSIPGLSLATGASACVRWLDPNDAGNDHGLAIDNLVISGQ